MSLDSQPTAKVREQVDRVQFVPVAGLDTNAEVKACPTAIILAVALSTL